MHRQHAFARSSFFDPDNRIRRQPVVRVNDVERSVFIFFIETRLNEDAAHVVDLVDEAGIQLKIAAMVMYVFDDGIMRLLSAPARKNVYIMLAPSQRRAELADMHPDATDRNGVQRFPGK